MAFLCLIGEKADTFKKAILNGEINPEKLAGMTSADRRAFLTKYVGEFNAKGVNAKFESKLLLKNQQAGLATWARQLAGIKPEARRDLLARIEKMDTFLNPADKKAFLSDLVETKLGVRTTLKEATHIAKLSSAIKEAEANPGRTSLKVAENSKWTPNAHDMKYGYAQYDMVHFISDLKNNASKLKFSDLAGRRVIEIPGHLIKMLFDVSKSIGASLDDSFIGRQGAKAFWTNHTAWRQEALRSFVTFAKGFKNGDEAHRGIIANLMADPHYAQAVKDGLAIGSRDDVFATSLPGKIPILGRAFNASEAAYDGMAQTLRMKIYKQNMKTAFSIGRENVPKEYGKNMAMLTNSITGRGSFGRGEALANHANIAFYSLRFLKSNIDFLVLHPLGHGVGGTLDAAIGKEGSKLMSKAQGRAITNLAKVVAGTASIMALANVLKPGSVEFDPRSSDFGKIRVGDTRFDITGGMGSIVILAARLGTQSSKSSGTGKVTQLNSGVFGSQTLLDSIYSFMEGKLSPVGGIIRDRLKGTDMQGNPFNLGTEALGLITPLGVKNFMELQSNPNAANTTISVLLDGLGISSNTYSPSGQGSQGSSWSQSQSKDLLAFKAKVGNQAFQVAGKKFDDTYNTWISTTRKDPRYLALPETQKQALITAEKAKITKSIFGNASFKYKAQKTDKTSFKSLLQ